MTRFIVYSATFLFVFLHVDRILHHALFCFVHCALLYFTLSATGLSAASCPLHSVCLSLCYFLVFTGHFFTPLLPTNSPSNRFIHRTYHSGMIALKESLTPIFETNDALAARNTIFPFPAYTYPKVNTLQMHNPVLTASDNSLDTCKLFSLPKIKHPPIPQWSNRKE